MRKYVSLASALLIGTVVAHEKKSAFQTAVETKKAAVQAKVAHHGAGEKVKPYRSRSYRSKSHRGVKQVYTSVTTRKGELTSNRTLTSPYDVER